jgi:hypothetical protein
MGSTGSWLQQTMTMLVTFLLPACVFTELPVARCFVHELPVARCFVHELPVATASGTGTKVAKKGPGFMI